MATHGNPGANAATIDRNAEAMAPKREAPPVTVRVMTDDELVAARRGTPLEQFGTQRTGLPKRPAAKAWDFKWKDA